MIFAENSRNRLNDFCGPTKIGIMDAVLTCRVTTPHLKGFIMRKKRAKRVFLGTSAECVIIMLSLLLGGCMTVSDTKSIVQNKNSTQTFNGKTVAVLPVKTQTSLAPDSVMSLRHEINKRLGPALQKKLPSADIKDLPAVVDQLNKKNMLPTLEQLFSTYDSMGVVDKQKTAALGRALGSSYLLLSRLKSEKLDIVISRGMGASLELMIVDAQTGSMVWGGAGEWKRGGMFGTGQASPEEAAENLVNLAFESL
ncbi:MAG: hypothetical protein WAL90_03025 [Desulfobacterales bacterium]